MATRRGGPGTFTDDDWVLLTELVRFEWLGYVRFRDLIIGGSISFVVLTGVIAILPLNQYTLLALGILTVIALVIAFVGGTLTYNRRIDLYSVDGLYIAKDRETGHRRHGVTPEEAVRCLSNALDMQEADVRTDRQ